MTVGLDPLASALRHIELPQLRAGMGEYLSAVADDAWQGNPLPSLLRWLERAGTRQGEATEFDPASGMATAWAPSPHRMLSADEANERGKALGLTFDADVNEGEYLVLERERRRQLANDLVFRRARNEGGYGAGKAALSVATELFTGAVDPLNLVGAFLPVLPAGSRAASVLLRLGPNVGPLLRGGIEGAAGAALLEPIVAGERAAWDPDYGFSESLINVAFGAGLGGGLHWFGSKIAGWRRASASAAADAPPAAGGVVADAPPAAPREVPQLMAEAVERTAPETREASLRASIAALAQDRPVEVEPILRADPQWRVPEPATSRGALELGARGGASRLPAGDPVGEFRALQEGMSSLAAARDAELRGETWRTPVPRDWKPDDALLQQALRLRRGMTPDRPLPEPQSLSQWLRARGGIDRAAIEAGDFKAADLDRSPGLLRSRVANSKVGDQLDYVLQAALDDGFYADVKARGEELDANTFLNDVAADAHGVRKTYREEDESVTRWRDQQAYFDATRQWIESEGIDVANMRPRDLAWLMSLDTRRQRIEVLAHRVDRLTDEESLELMDRLDRELADAAAADMAVARASLAEADPAKMVGDGEPLSLADLERINVAIERFEQDLEGRGRPAGPLDAARDEGGAGARADGAPDEGAAGREEGDQGRARPEGEGLDSAVAALQRGAADPANDLHADLAAAERAKVEAAKAAPDPREEASQLEADYGHLLTDEDRLALEAAVRPHEETIKAVEALAQCRVGGDMPAPPTGGAA